MPELPKLSQVTSVLAQPEQMFESGVKDATGQEIPKGPQSRLLDVQKGIEAGEAPTPGAPEMPAGMPSFELPSLPELGGMGPEELLGGGGSSPEEETESSVGEEELSAGEEELSPTEEEIGTPKMAAAPTSGGTTGAEMEEATKGYGETNIKFA